MPPLLPESKLTACPDCGAEVSRRAMSCPRCGGPVAQIVIVASAPPAAAPEKPAQSTSSRGVYCVLAFFFGLIGVHNFYAGFVAAGFVQLILSLTGVGLVVTVPWVIAEMLFQRTDGKGLRFQ
ncbi:MAG: NINE protein [Verrucomicrobia bacterium]|nr:NINE protein [Verrucomicrobiota bacterium]